MSGNSIRDKCSVNMNLGGDTFVGIKCTGGDISITFPLGYDISDSEELVRKDVFLLIKILAAYTENKNSEIPGMNIFYDYVEFPIQAYIEILNDYYARGYYKEKETQYTVSRKGKINWSRTIKTQRPYIQGKDVFYLDFVTKKVAVNENEMITLIHEYCVYESFEKIGWLFSDGFHALPRIKLNKKLFLSVIREKLLHTYNDRNKKLFMNMIAVIKNQGDESAKKNYRYGTYRFEYVWEKMIDRIYGIANKSDYFPRTIWNIGGTSINNACLEPDTVMLCNGNVYVLDAKYYKYGVTGNVRDLPESTSINKQITYGEYIAECEKFSKKHGKNYKVYNAFLMPFNAEKYDSNFDTDKKIIKIGEAVSTWKSGMKEYEKIQGILIDIKHLMKVVIRQDEAEMMKLAKVIEGNKSVGSDV